MADAVFFGFAGIEVEGVGEPMGRPRANGVGVRRDHSGQLIIQGRVAGGEIGRDGLRPPAGGNGEEKKIKEVTVGDHGQVTLRPTPELFANLQLLRPFSDPVGQVHLVLAVKQELLADEGLDLAGDAIGVE